MKRHLKILAVLLFINLLTACGEKAPLPAEPLSNESPTKSACENDGYQSTSPEDLREHRLKKCRPIFDKYPEATSHTIVLYDGEVVRIPKEYKHLDLYKNDWVEKSFNQDQLAKIIDACQRERQRNRTLKQTFGDLQQPMDNLCERASALINKK